MERSVPIGNYSADSGLHLEWSFGFEIEVAIRSGTVVIRANEAGLRSLAQHLLTLAEGTVPDGTHIHLDPGRAPRRLIPRHIHGPREPERARQCQRVRPLRRHRTARCLQVPQELRHRPDSAAVRIAQAVRPPQSPDRIHYSLSHEHRPRRPLSLRVRRSITRLPLVHSTVRSREGLRWPGR
jgi:hypothetical protein